MEISKLNNNITPSGTMAISNKARILKEQGKPVIGFGAGEPDFPTPSHVIEEVKIASENPTYHKYTAVGGLPILRDEISRTTREYSNFEVNPDNVVVTNGGKQAILTTFMSLLDPGDEVLIPSPYWTTYPEAVKISGGEPVIVNTDFENDFKVTVGQLEEKFTEKTKVLVWVSPSNPTGVVYSKEEAEEIYNWAFDKNIWILSDELYEHLVYEGVTSPSPATIDKNFEKTVVVNGVAKAYSMTGWRVGWIMGNDDVIGLSKKIQSHATSNVANISQVAAYSALKNGLGSTNEMKKAFDKRRNYALNLFNTLENIRVPNATGAFYVFPDVSHYTNGLIDGVSTSIELCDWLLEKFYIAFVPGEVFGKEGFLRCSYALSDQDLEEGLTRFKDALESI